MIKLHGLIVEWHYAIKPKPHGLITFPDSNKVRSWTGL